MIHSNTFCIAFNGSSHKLAYRRRLASDLGVLSKNSHNKVTHEQNAQNLESEKLDDAVLSQPNTPKFPSSLDLEEPLCVETKNRFVLFPIANHEIWAMYKEHVASFWTAEGIDLHSDRRDWALLNVEEQQFIKNALAFFAVSKGTELDNLSSNFLTAVKLPEARCFYAFQGAMERIHSETHCLLIDTLIESESEKMELLAAAKSAESIKARAKWAARWMSEDVALCQRLAAFACSQRIFLSASFCALFWLKTRGLMPGLAFSSELISRDKRLHTDFACLLYKCCRVQLDDDTLREIVASAVECEQRFVCDSLAVGRIGMDSPSMAQYIESVADGLCDALGHSKIYGTSSPFEWMEMLSLRGNSNSIEKRVVASLHDDGAAHLFTLDADF